MVFMVSLILVVILLSKCDSEDKIVPAKTPGILEYTIVNRQDVSYRNTPRMVFWVVVRVGKIPSEDQMQKIALSIWKDENQRWEEFTVFMYLPGMDTGGVAYAVAKFTPSGLSKLRIHESSLYGTKWQEFMD